MTAKEDILKKIVEKSGKSEEEVQELIKDKINELSGLISEDGALHIIANELNIEIGVTPSQKTVNLVKIDEITEPKVSISFYGKVIKKYDKINFSNSKTDGTVQSILVGDETGINRVTFWNDKVDELENVNENDVLKFTNVYTRENNQNRIDVNYGSYSAIDINPDGVKIEVKAIERQEAVEKKINDIVENDKNIKISGIVVDLDIPRFYLGCPECFKKVSQDEDKYVCLKHGEITPTKVPILNLSIDDGDSTISVVCFRDNAEKITNLSKDDIFVLVDDIDVYRDYVKKVMEKKVEIVGNASMNNMTGDLQMIVNAVLSSDINEEIPKSNKTIKTDNKKTENKDEGKKEKLNATVSKKDLSNKNDGLEEDNNLDIEEIDIDDI